MITSKQIEAAVSKVEAVAKSIYGNCPWIDIYEEPENNYSVSLTYESDDKEIQWTVCKGLQGDAVLNVINNELLDIIKRIYVVSEEDEGRLTLRDKFLEARDLFPYLHYIGKREETMLGECLTWCRDYFGGPKDEMLAYMILGYWQNKLECEQRWANK